MQKSKSLFMGVVVLTMLLSWPQLLVGHENPTLSHSGGTDECGCHNNRKTGEYHCHKRKKRGGSCPASIQSQEGKDAEVKVEK